MARTLLDNEQWDFGSNCFVCEPKNDRGLGVPFYLDDEARTVVTDFTPEAHHSGAPAFAHGGFRMALLDEGQAWAAIAIAHRFGVTKRSEVTFVRPVRTGQAHALVRRVDSHEGHDLVASGEILDARAKVCVAVRSDFYAMTKEEAAIAIGAQSARASEYTEP